VTLPPREIHPDWGELELPDAAYTVIVNHLRNRRQFDPDAYQDRCLRRRIARRVHSSGQGDIAGYLRHLAGDDAELDFLLAALSLHVSRFFRDPATFRVLEAQLLPDLCRQARAAGRDTLRLWSVGCASGEEAYSLALLVDELAPGGLSVAILGTDISAPVLEAARSGLYDPARLAEVPPVVLDRYFIREGHRYRLCERIRSRVRFEQHDLLAAPAYSGMDLILCRNVLIYFSRDEQARILERFAAALPLGGVLVLGSSETLPGNPGLFQAERPAERIFRRTATVVAP
jgi:chemotaxis protein methyltransferase CheR